MGIASKELKDKLAKEAADAAAAYVAAKKQADADKAEIQKRFSKGGLVLEVQVSKEGVPSEDVTGQDVASSLKRSGVTVDAEAVELPEIAELGEYVAKLRLHPDVTTSVKVVV